MSAYHRQETLEELEVRIKMLYQALIRAEVEAHHKREEAKELARLEKAE
jgi:hypothetical protein